METPTGISTSYLDRLSPSLRKITANVSWLMLDRVLRMGFGLFVGVWIARYLGPARFGDLNFAMAMVALFGTASSLGLETIVMREVLHDAPAAHEILGTSLLLRAGAGIFAAAVTIAAVSAMHSTTREGLLLVAILCITLFFQAGDTADAYFQSQLRSRLTVITKNSAFLLFAAVRVALIYFHAPLWTFAAAYTGEISVGSVALLLVYRAHGGDLFRWRFHGRRAAQLLRQSWPVLLSGMAIMVYVRLDMVMLKSMQGDFAVGIYSAATRISEVWYFIPTAIVTSVSPAILAVKDDAVLFHQRMRRLFALMTVCALSVGTVIALLSGRLIHTLYANAYDGAAPVLAVHVWASVFVFLGVAQSPYDLSKDLLKFALYRTLAGAAFNAGLNLVLIPRYGALGAAIATVVSYAISGVFANALHKKTRPLFFMQMRSFVPQRFW